MGGGTPRNAPAGTSSEVESGRASQGGQAAGAASVTLSPDEFLDSDGNAGGAAARCQQWQCAPDSGDWPAPTVDLARQQPANFPWQHEQWIAAPCDTDVLARERDAIWHVLSPNVLAGGTLARQMQAAGEVASGCMSSIAAADSAVAVFTMPAENMALPLVLN